MQANLSQKNFVKASSKPTNLKILHVLQNYEPSKGGTQLLFKSVSEKLNKKFGDKVTIATTNSMYDPGAQLFKALESYSFIEGIHVNRFGFIRIKRRLLLLLKYVLDKLNIALPKSLQDALRVPQSKAMMSFINDFQADLVCASSSNYVYMDYASYRFKLPRPKPFVFMGAVHFDEEKPPQLPQFILENINASDLYIANTSFEKNMLSKLGVDTNKIRVVGCGVDLGDDIHTNKNSAREALALPVEATVIGYIGRFAPSKDVMLLIDAFVDLDLANTYLLLAGASNTYLDEIRKKIALLPRDTAAKVILIPDFKEDEKRTVFKSLDVFVSPSFSESFGIVFLESWACKVPVIGSDIGAIASVIEHNRDGLLFKPRDKDALKQALLIYLNDEALRIAHAEAGLKKVKESYTWDIIAAKYRVIYMEAIDLFNKKCADLQA